ncbi:hypothetical protein DY000_02004658 [Brassica cretica]|uniref:Uncharacterized protein n=1 Tax=Brassica cretica TaxID=69181 RepID=A0ABQ7CKA1_BRACR|nr:hypothetical protein DY000_02004658 [Brassica cretica]
MRMIPAVLNKMLPATSREKKEEQFTYRLNDQIITSLRLKLAADIYEEVTETAE